MTHVIVDQPAQHVARILINRPAKRNAVDHDVRTQLIDAFASCLADQQCRAIVFGGVGGNLSAGGDLPSMVGITEEQARLRMQHGHELCRLVGSASIPIVTAAQGYAAGAAVGLALLGDVVVAEPATKILLPFLKIGLVPDWGLLRSLPMRVGLPVARRLIFAAETTTGEEAQRIGLIDTLTADNQAMDVAVADATRLAQLPPQAVALVKQRLRVWPTTFEQDLAQEEIDQAQCMVGDEFKEGFAAFTEKRAARFTKM